MGGGGCGGGGGETEQGARGRKDAPNKGRSSSSWPWRKASGEKGSQGHTEASATAEVEAAIWGQHWPLGEKV